MSDIADTVLKRFAAKGADLYGDEPLEEDLSCKRLIPKNHSFEPKSLKPMAKMLWACSVSLGHALTAYREFTKLKSSAISPDGMIGGRGYVMSVKDIRQKLQEACEALSEVSDTIHDEINAPHWGAKLNDLMEDEKLDFQQYLEEAETILDDPEAYGEEESEEVEEPLEDPSTWEEDEPSSSQVPTGGASEEQTTLGPKVKKSSSLPEDAMAGTPRVINRDRGTEESPVGTFTKPEDKSDDDWNRKLNEPIYNYARVAESFVPEGDFDRRPTDAYDFGIGFGAKGEGLGYSEVGPRSGLPDDFGPPVARSDYYDGPKGNYSSIKEMWLAESTLPGDGTSVPINTEMDLMNTNNKYERLDNPYVKRTEQILRSDNAGYLGN